MKRTYLERAPNPPFLHPTEFLIELPLRKREQGLEDGVVLIFASRIPVQPSEWVVSEIILAIRILHRE